MKSYYILREIKNGEEMNVAQFMFAWSLLVEKPQIEVFKKGGGEVKIVQYEELSPKYLNCQGAFFIDFDEERGSSFSYVIFEDKLVQKNN